MSSLGDVGDVGDVGVTTEFPLVVENHLGLQAEWLREWLDFPLELLWMIPEGLKPTSSTPFFWGMMLNITP